MLLNEQTQRDIINLLSGNTQFLEMFKIEGMEVNERLFEGEHRRKFRLLEAACKEGFEEITQEYSEIHNLDIPLEKVTKGHYIDLKKRLTVELESLYKKETTDALSKKMKEYETASYENRERVERELIDIILQSRKTGITNNTKDIYDIIEEDFVYQEGAEKVPAFLSLLDDNILLGGFPRNQFSVVSALSGHGKTTMLVQTGTLQASNGYKVLFLSLEQDQKHIASGTISTLSDDDKENKLYFDTSRITKDNQEEIQTRAKELAANHLKGRMRVDDSTYKTQDDLMRRITRAAIVEKYDVILIDNFQNEPGTPGLKEYESYKRFADSLMNLARNKDHKAVIIAASQLSGNIKNSWTKGARVLNDNAATQLKLIRPEVTEEDQEKGVMDTVEIFSEKARFGKLHKSEKFSFIGEKGIIGAITHPEYDEVEANDWKAEKRGYIKERSIEEDVLFMANAQDKSIKEVKEEIGLGDGPLREGYFEEEQEESEQEDEGVPF